ncbi:protein serine/threonine kinase [Pelomyxa schiedti]|nr:protein serine/threonine kinase [Pelomyxa schiedti]
MKFPIMTSHNLNNEPQGFSITADVKLTVLCTSSFETNVIITSSKSEADTNLKFVALSVRLESTLSTSLDPDELQLEERPIGEGGYGIVFRGTWRGQNIAAKIVKNPEGKNTMTEFQQEVHILESLRSPYIVSFIGAVNIPGKLVLVTEFVKYGSLTSCLDKYPFSLQLKVKCLLDCCLGMVYLHGNSMLHRDLKTDNLLMSSIDVGSEVNCKISEIAT